jgi:hypothetical protein
MFDFASLLSIIEEQVESLGDKKLALMASQFTQFHNNCLNQRRGGQKMDTSTTATPTTLFPVAPMKGKQKAGPHDHHSGRRKGKREYTSGKHKSKGGFDK